MTFLITLIAGWGVPSWLAKLLGWALPILLALGALWGTVDYLEHKGASTQKATDTVAAVEAHSQTVQQARTDEHAAQATADAITQTVAKTDDATTALVRSQMEETHNALQAAPDGPDAPPLDGSVFTASLNTLIQRANGSADAADAQP